MKRGTRKVSSMIQIEGDGSSLKDFLDKVEAMMTGFEPEHLKELKVEFDTELDEYSINMTIYHDRPETDQELAERITREVVTTIRAAEAQEKKERGALAALQERYPDSPASVLIAEAEAEAALDRLEERHEVER